MLLEILTIPPAIAVGWCVYGIVKDAIKRQSPPDPDKEFKTIGSFSYSMVKKDHKGKSFGQTMQARVILYDNALGERKVETRISSESQSGSFEKWVKAQSNWINFIQPWLEGTIDTRQLIEIAGCEGGPFKIATVPYFKYKTETGKK